VTGRVLPSGEHAVLVEVDSLAEVLALHRLLWVRGRTPGLVDAVTGARTLLLICESASALAGIRSRVHEALGEIDAQEPDGAGTTDRTPGDGGSSADIVEVAVRYDGPDLADVASLTGLSADEVVAAHTGRLWLVGFAGFAPGFAYLVDGDPRLDVPRRATPRTRVPAGAVGLAGEFSGVYPRSSPGGWQLIGHTDQVLWDLDRDPPALLRPGLRVRFVDAGRDR
jgi:KipI family sensor histidine kinase inhibitor